MAGRYEISDQGWALIEDIVSPDMPAGRGRPRRDDRQMLNGIFLDPLFRGQMAGSARALRPVENGLSALSSVAR